MSDELILCMESCRDSNNSGALVGNHSYDLECITQCSQRHTSLYRHTAEKYTNIFQIIAIVLITFGLIGKVFNCIIFLRKPLRGTSTGLLLFLKTIFDFVPLLWTFIFDTKLFVKDEQLNASKVICVLTRSSDIFVSWSIGFVILAGTIRVATIIHSKYLPEPTTFLVSILILLMMFCGICYNWHVFYYQSLVETKLNDDTNETFTYCNILFGRQLGYFSFGGFQSTEELLYNAPIVNFIVSSLIPFTIVALTNLIIIVRVVKNPSTKHLTKINSYHNGMGNPYGRTSSIRSSFEHGGTQITRKDVSYETTITLTTSCVFLTTNSIASIYVYVKSSYRSKRSGITEDIKTSTVYLILRMVALIDTVLEFYIYFLTGKKFRQEVYQVLGEILQYTPFKNCFKTSSIPTTNNNNNNTNTNTNTNFRPLQQRKFHSEQQVVHQHKNNHSHYLSLTQSSATSISRLSSYMDSPYKQKMPSPLWCDTDETLDRIESTV